MNLFTGVVVDSFNQEKDKLAGYSMLTEEQREWVEIQIKVLLSEPEIKKELN